MSKGSAALGKHQTTRTTILSMADKAKVGRLMTCASNDGRGEWQDFVDNADDGVYATDENGNQITNNAAHKVGTLSPPPGNYVVVGGARTTVRSDFSIALGGNSSPNFGAFIGDGSEYAIVIGTSSITNSLGAIAIGKNLAIFDGNYSIAIGYSSTLQSSIFRHTDSVCIGRNCRLTHAIANSSGKNVLIGSFSDINTVANGASTLSCICIGDNSHINNSRETDVITNCLAMNGAVIDISNDGIWSNGQAIGPGTNITDSANSLVFGNNSYIEKSNDSLVFGSFSDINAVNGASTLSCICIGNNSHINNSRETDVITNCLAMNGAVIDISNDGIWSNGQAIGPGTNITDSANSLVFGSNSYIRNSSTSLVIGYNSYITTTVASTLSQTWNTIVGGDCAIEGVIDDAAGVTNSTCIGNGSRITTSLSGFTSQCLAMNGALINGGIVSITNSMAIGGGSSIIDSSNSILYGPNSSILNSPDSVCIGSNTTVFNQSGNSGNANIAIGSSSAAGVSDRRSTFTTVIGRSIICQSTFACVSIGFSNTIGNVGSPTSNPLGFTNCIAIGSDLDISPQNGNPNINHSILIGTRINNATHSVLAFNASATPILNTVAGVDLYINTQNGVSVVTPQYSNTLPVYINGFLYHIMLAAP